MIKKFIFLALLSLGSASIFSISSSNPYFQVTRRIRNPLTFHALLLADEKFEEAVKEALDSHALDNIKAKLSKKVSTIYLLMSDVDSPLIAKSSLVTKAENQEFKRFFNLDIPVGSPIIRIFKKFITKRTPQERIAVLEHELWHQYHWSLDKGKEYYFKMRDLYLRMSAEFANEPEYANWFLFLDENRRVQLQLKEGSNDSVKKDADDDLNLIKKEVESLREESASQKRMAMNFFAQYLNVGILGFELGGEAEFAAQLKRELKKTYTPYLGRKAIKKIIKGPIAYIKEKILSKGLFYVPSSQEFRIIVEKLKAALP